MAPLAIRVPHTVPTLPLTYQLAGTGELDIKSIVATFDGTSAPSDFFPVLSIYTSDGILISRTRTSTAIAAGGLGVVTFAPFLRQQAAASGVYFAEFRGSQAGINAGTTGVECEVGWQSVAVTEASQAPVDRFDYETAFAGRKRAVALEGGLVLINAFVQWINVFAGARYIELQSAAFPAVDPPVYRVVGDSGDDYLSITVLTKLSQSLVPASIKLVALQSSGSSQGVEAVMWITALS